MVVNWIMVIGLNFHFLSKVRTDFMVQQGFPLICLLLCSYGPLLDSILRKFNPQHTFSPCYVKTFDIVLPSVYISLTWPLPLRFSHQNFL
jgi:hypothetical protein